MIARELNRTLRVRVIVGMTVLGLWLAPSAAAAPFNVTPGSGDVADPTPMDGMCDVGGGVCTVRAAVQSANGIAGDDDINIPAGSYTLSIGGVGEEMAATGDLDITQSVDINGLGAGATVNANMIDRVFDISTGIVNFDRITITGGLVATSGLVDGGAGFRNNTGTVTLTNSAVTVNQVVRVNGPAAGGGIWNPSGSLTVIDSTIGDNVATTAAGGGGFGGGIDTLGNLTLTRSTVEGNSAGGPGITGLGGGISVGMGTMTITNSTISGNTAGGAGGNGTGGGIGGSATTTIASTTIFGNTAAGAGMGGNVGDQYFLRNTIVANGTANTGGNCSVAQTSQGNNLESPTNQCSFVQMGDLFSIADPLIGGLTNNGGPTETRSLLTGSPAINVGNPAAPGGAPPACPATDQRGLPRGGAAGQCDIGAFEVQPETTTTPPPTTQTPPAIVPGPTGQRAAALKKCKKKKGQARKKCKKKANKLPV